MKLFLGESGGFLLVLAYAGLAFFLSFFLFQNLRFAISAVLWNPPGGGFLIFCFDGVLVIPLLYVRLGYTDGIVTRFGALRGIVSGISDSGQL